MDRRIDLALAGLLVAFGVAVVLAAMQIRLGLYKDAVGPRAFPIGLGLLIAAGGAAVAIRRLRKWKSETSNIVPSEGTEDMAAYPASAKRASAIIGMTIAYAVLFQPLGFLLATPAYIAGALAIMGERRWSQLLPVALAFTLLAYIAFAQILSVRIPVGPLQALFRDLGWVYL